MRAHTIMLPDLGEERTNRELDALIGEFLQGLTRLFGKT
jgi:hypothetical protein